MKKEHVGKRLTDGQRWMIRRDYREGVKQTDLAIKYGVSQCTISLVCHPEAYQHRLEYNRERYLKKKEGA